MFSPGGYLLFLGFPCWHFQESGCAFPLFLLLSGMHARTHERYGRSVPTFVPTCILDLDAGVEANWVFRSLMIVLNAWVSRERTAWAMTFVCGPCSRRLGTVGCVDVENGSSAAVCYLTLYHSVKRRDE